MEYIYSEDRGSEFHPVKTMHTKEDSMKQILSLAMALICLAVAGAALAYPSLAGPTGTGVLPNAAVVSDGQLQVAANGYGARQVDNLTIPVLLEYGAGSNTEVGGGITAGDVTGWSFNGKISSPSHSREGANFAVGARFAYCDTNAFDRDAYQVYGVATKDFHSADTSLRASVGLNWTDIVGLNESYGPHWGFNHSSNAVRPFFSLNLNLPHRVNLAIDYQLRNDGMDSSAMYSVVARYPFSPSFDGEVGITNMNLDGVTGNNATGLFAGINYLFTSDTR